MADPLEAELIARVRAALGSSSTAPAVSGLRRLPGGVSSLTYAAELLDPVGPRSVVIKVAPPGMAPVRNRDVLRQAKIIAALHDRSTVPVPAVLAEDGGDPPLFVMELAPGDSYEPGTDVIADPPAADVVHARALAAVRSLAHMQAVSPAGLGIAEEPVTGVRDELDRWATLLETVDPALAPGQATLRDRLGARVPQTRPATVLHGDYRMGNMLFDGDRLTAVIDWEIWSLGDPRHDLAWLLMHLDPPHSFRTERPAADEAAAAALPSAAELLDAYLGAAGGDGTRVADLDWFLALCHYKVVSTVAAIAKRNRRRPEPDPQLLTAEASLPRVLARAHSVLDRIRPGA